MALMQSVRLGGSLTVSKKGCGGSSGLAFWEAVLGALEVVGLQFCWIITDTPISVVISRLSGVSPHARWAHCLCRMVNTVNPWEFSLTARSIKNFDG